MGEDVIAIPRRKFYFLRHGEADWNVERRCMGQVDRPLTPRGRAQAEAARPLCAGLPLGRIVTSPLRRAADTAAIIAAGRLPISTDARLMEAHLGEMQGLREDDPANPFLREWIAGRDVPGAETYAMLRTRVAAAVAEGLSIPNPDPPLFVAHAGVYHALRTVLGVGPERVRHCVPYEHEPVSDGWAVTLVEGP